MFMAYAQGALLNGLIPDMVYQDEDFMQFGTILLPDVRMMSNDMLKKLNKYVKDGGNLLIFGVPGIKDEFGNYRDKEEINKALMINTALDVDGNDENLGDIYFTSLTPFAEDYYEVSNVDRWFGTELRTKKTKLITEQMAKNQGDMLRALLPENLLTIKEKNTNELYLTQVYFSHDDKYLLLHILNANDTLSTDKLDIGHSDTIKYFMEDCEEKNEEIKITIIDYPNYDLNSGEIISPEFEDTKKVSLKRNETGIEVTIPKDIFSGYGIVLIKMR